MPKHDTMIEVVGAIGQIPNIRAQLAKLAKDKGTSIPEIAEKLGISKQRLYALLGSEQIKEAQLEEILAAMNAHPSELHV